MPQPERRAVTAYAPSQLELYRSLPTNCSISTMVSAKTPTIAHIKNDVSLNDARALLSIAVCEVCDFFNVGKNMNDVQIALTVDLIIERFWYFKLEEIKYCLRRAMMHEKVYYRLDGNIIIGWLNAYDAERTEEAMRASEQEDMQRLNATPAAEGAISLAEYMERLKQRADTDEEAARKLGVFTEMASQPTIRTKEEQTEKDNEFRKFKIDYIIRQNAQRRNNGENL